MYWVTMTDKFMSGWGKSKDKTNKLVIICDTYAEAEIVADNAANRSEMKYINICAYAPKYSSSRYYVSYHDKNDYPCWFTKGYFKN